MILEALLDVPPSIIIACSSSRQVVTGSREKDNINAKSGRPQSHDIYRALASCRQLAKIKSPPPRPLPSLSLSLSPSLVCGGKQLHVELNMYMYVITGCS